jgi:hypothetical protein
MPLQRRGGIMNIIHELDSWSAGAINWCDSTG